jgi:NAD(P)-dependent dehydrogenase (short-subunit alcohol dehydrogenase family)
MGPTRTLLISGASRGIGRSIAERLLAEGHRLSLGVRHPEAMAGNPLWEASLRHPDRVRLHPYDARDPEQAKAWVEATLEHFGRFSGLIHCAGLFSRAGLLFAPSQQTEIEALWQVNLMGPWWLTRAAWPALVASGDGRVITLVSMSGLRVKGAKGCLAAYPVSKFALMGLCQTMRNEGWDAGIRVTALCPGWVNTAMAAAVKAIPPEAMTQPEDLAAITAMLLSLPARAVPFELKINCLLET